MVDRFFSSQRLTVFVAVMLVAGAAAPAKSGSSAFVISQAIEAPSAVENQKALNESSGTKNVLIRWAIGARDKITKLGIPLAYRPISGKVLPEGRDLDLPRYATEVAFKAMLWDMSVVPAQENKDVVGSERNKLIFGMIKSIFSGSTDLDEAQHLKIRAAVGLEGLRNNFYRARSHLQIGEKEGRFGLRRIGAIHGLREHTPVGLQDFYFTGDEPASSSDFMLCSDEAIPDDPPPGRRENPGCQHWFALPELSATVQIVYRRRHLAEWREIKRKVRILILSWKSSNGGD